MGDLYDPIAVVVDIPPSYDVWPDEAGNEIYPEVDPVYTTRNIPPRYIKGFIEVRRKEKMFNQIVNKEVIQSMRQTRE